MKKIINLVCLLVIAVSVFTNTQPANAMGAFYTEATYPAIATGVKSYKPISELKKGTAKTMNILWLVETGDAGIKEAAQNAGIKQVHFIDMKVKTILFFFKRITTNVYGE